MLSPDEHAALEEAAAKLAGIAGRLPDESLVGQSLAKIADECEQLVAVLPVQQQAA
jgi:hypothetical protein